MANTLLNLLVKLGLDSSDYSKGIDAAGKKATGLQGTLAKVGGAAVTGGMFALGAGAAATAGLLASSVKPASDLNESLNAVNVVFGEGAGQMLDYGKTAATTVGLSQSAFNSMATTTGAFLQNVGFDMDSAGSETIALTERAADMASVFNTDVATAMGAIQSGLKGEFNPLEQFGVKLNAAAIEAQGMAMGLADADGKLSDSAKATAALQLIYEQTAKVQGDFANTSDGLANQQRIMGATFEDVRAKIGTALLPILTTLGATLLKVFSDPAFQAGLQSFINGLTGLVNMAVTNLPIFLNWVRLAFGWLMDNQGVLVAAVTAIAAAIAVWAYTTIAAAVPAIIAFMTAAWPVVLVIGLIAAAAYLLYEAWTNNFGGIQDKAAAAWAYIQPILQALWDWLAVNVPAGIQVLVDFWNGTLMPALNTAWSWISANIIPLFQAIGELIGTVVTLAVTALAGAWQNILQPALEKVWGFISTNLKPILEKLWPIVKTVAEWVGGALTRAFDGIGKAIQAVIGFINTMIEKLKGIELPDWLTPGSPTPFEIGLLGIRDALKAVSREGLPELQAGLNVTGATVSGVGMVDGAGAGGGVGPVNIYIDGAKDPTLIAQEIDRILGRRARVAKLSGAGYGGA